MEAHEASQAAIEELTLEVVIGRHAAGDIESAESGYRILISNGSQDDLCLGNLAVICLNSGRMDEAEQLLNKVIEHSPGNICALLNLGVVFRKRGFVDEAAKKYEEALSINPDYVDALNNLGLIQLDRLALEQATELFGRAIKVNPGLWNSYFNLANVQIKQGDRDGAIANYRKALEINHNHVDSLLNLGVAYASSNDTISDAIDCYRKILELNPSHPSAWNNLGNALKITGKEDEGIDCYRKAIQFNPDYSEAYYNLGISLKLKEKYDEAIACFSECIRLSPEQAALYHYNIGVNYHHQNKLTEALDAYRKAEKLTPCDPQIVNDIGVALQMQGHNKEAMQCYQRVLELNPEFVSVYLNMGVACENFEEAIKCYRKALELSPDYAEVHNNLGLALQASGRSFDALIHLEKAVELSPRYADAHFNLGIAYHSKGDLDNACQAYEKAIEIRPNYAKAYLNLGLCRGGSMSSGGEVEKLDRAVACYRKALEFDPDYAEAHNNMGLAIQGYCDLDEALKWYRRAVELKPRYPEALNNIGHVLREQDLVDEAIESHLRAAEVRAENLESKEFIISIAKHLQLLERIPVIYNTVDEIQAYRDEYLYNLTQASQLVAQRKGRGFTKDEVSILRGVLFGLTNFYLAYQQLNDIDLQRAYSKVATEILYSEIGPFLEEIDISESKVEAGAETNVEAGVEAKVGAAAPRKIRLGIASELLKAHNGSFWAYDWFFNLPRQDYEFFAYSLNGGTDEQTRAFANLGTFRWLPFRPSDYHESLAIIKNDRLDILLIPDVGMSASSRIISLTRLAPIQCVGWGHPMTTGSDTIDFYLGSELQETEESDSHYSEELVRLANVGLYFYPMEPPTTPLSRADFDLPEDRFLYGSIQSLFKYLPQYDFLFPSIAKNVPDSLFVFAGNKSDRVTEIFEKRIAKAFEQAGLDYKHYVKMLPRMSLDKFYHLLSVLDVNLDSVGWSGGVTTMRSITMELPVVTWPGQFMRGRHSYGMLKMIELDELIGFSGEEFIDIASRLGNDEEFRIAITEKMRAQKGKLFRDAECIRHLDRFFKSEVDKRRSARPAS